jgi:hypothetical protein
MNTLNEYGEKKNFEMIPKSSVIRNFMESNRDDIIINENMNKDIVIKNQEECHIASIKALNEISRQFRLIRIIENSTDKIWMNRITEENQNAKNVIRVLEENNEGLLARI